MGGGDPPVLKDGDSYSQYRRDILIWQLSTPLASTKQAARAILMMHGKVREHASRMEIDELKKENGLEILIGELDGYFKKDSTQELFLAIEKLEKYKRDPEKESIIQYIEEFIRLNDRVKELVTGDHTYEDGILAYRLLSQASLSEQDTKLVRATVKTLSFVEMVTALKKCLGDGVLLSKNDSSDGVVIKQEPQDTFMTDECQWDERDIYYGNYYGNRGNGKGGRGSNRGRGNFRGKPRYSPYRGGSQGNQSAMRDRECDSGYKATGGRDGKKENSYDKYGNQMLCGLCGSKFHFKRNCPKMRRDAPSL